MTVFAKRLWILRKCVLNESREVFARRFMTNSKSLYNWENSICLPNTPMLHQIGTLIKKYMGEMDDVDLGKKVPNHVSENDVNKYGLLE